MSMFMTAAKVTRTKLLPDKNGVLDVKNLNGTLYGLIKPIHYYIKLLDA